MKEENKALDQVFEDHRESVIQEEIKQEKKPVKKVCTGHIVDCKLLNIRDAATIEGCILGVLDEHATVKILDKKDPYFYKIEYKDIVGYCMKQYIEEN